ncbi:MAG TPA: ABC transporter substrate-binding protein [Steroidobacteraceae bacterium]|jgi:phospholipid transport system substrate-binding protein|nr:ABC transporter substrate-binding protein [Steroidobacteraceae bacterium]
MSIATRTRLSGIVLALGLVSAQAQTPAPQGKPAPGAPAANATAPATGTEQGPTEVVQAAAQGMLNDLDKDRAAYKRDPAKVGQLVDKYLLPHFDTEYSARLVLGKYWRTATPDQREHFIDAFYHSLLTNYGSALTEFTADRLKIYPTTVDPAKPIATVRTEVKRDNGDRVAVNYYMHKTPQGWKAWDVVIDGISYVNSYRTDFGEQIEQQGIDAVIKRLEAGEKPGAIGKQTASKS